MVAIPTLEARWRRLDKNGKLIFLFPPVAMMPTRYLFVFAQAHDDFRIPEVLSIAELHGFSITFPDIPEERDPTRPYMILGLEKDEYARILARRCILVK